ncbi:uncharacterized protein DUF1211 [Micromonospora kangleipakensis]|uniref:Uncharacterized protein DUF1211 n=1 Tax=Micromonospora kangleipakensis TaxID=1077942 RepID=A0A4Q8BHY3_9ACTN|nr:TMEM175 family protein [Micromonospora kangleipakensis]RZU77652.1 uncharacterized protein DUF1211 [Micromonospora kangleipakensis]
MSAAGEVAGTPPVSDIGRMTGFSDGVFAIVITLLVIELRVPAHRPGELLAGLAEEAPASVAHVAAQRGRPVTGMVLYLFSGALGWFVSPVLGVIGIVIMIVFHALTSEGVRRRRPHRRAERR